MTIALDAARGRRLGLAALAALLIAFTVYSARFAIDFRVYWEAGAKVLAGDPTLYPPELPRDAFVQFRYTPVAAMLFAPWALLPLSTAAFLFGIAKLVALYSIVAMVTGLMEVDAAHRPRILALSFVGVAGYFMEEYRNGNVQLLLLWMVVGAVYLAERGRSRIPALLLAAATCIKVTVGIYLPYLLLRRRWALLGWTIAIGIGLMLLPYAVFGVEASNSLLQSFVDLNLHKATDPHNHSLRGAIQKHLTSLDVEEEKYGKINVLDLSEGTADALWLGLTVLIGATVLASTRWREDRTTRATGVTTATRTLLEISLWTTAFLLVSPHTQRQWLVSLFLPFVVLLALMERQPNGPPRRWIQAALVTTFAVGTLLPPLLPGREVALAYEVRSPYLLGTFAIFCVLVWLLRQPEK